MNKTRIAFFGTSHYSVIALETLKNAGVIPEVIVAQPDKPKGRNLEITPVEAKIWAENNNIPVLQPENLLDENFFQELKKFSSDVFVVVAYGKIIPQKILDIPARGALNIHASLLPKYRGASPIESAILSDDRDTGVTIMLIDDKMDHGPIIAEEKVEIKDWPPTARNLGSVLVSAGSNLLVKILPDWIASKIEAVPQDGNLATYTQKIRKNDGLIDLSQDPYKNFLKIQAFDVWPGTFFFAKRKEKEIRVIIKKAEYKNGELKILRVVPEGKREMDYSEFAKSL